MERMLAAIREAMKAERVLGVRRIALVEFALFTAVILVVDLLVGEGVRFRGVEPHPLWLPVLLLTVQYGTTEGLVAAVLATTALYAGNLPPQTIDQDIYAYLFGITWQPTLWVVSAVVFGELRMRQTRREAAVIEQLRQTEKRSDVLAEAYEQLNKVKESLETRVAGQLRTVVTTYQAAKAIEKLGPAEVMLGVSELVRAIMAPTKFSLFVIQNDALEAMINEGWSATDKYQRRFDATSPLFRAIVVDRKPLCVAKPEDERVLAGEALLAGPLANAETGQLIGMLKVEELGFLDVNLATVENFRILCEWIGTAFAQALRFESAESSSVMASDGNLMSAGFYDRQTKFLRALAERVGFDVPVVILRVDMGEGMSQAAKGAVSRALSDAVQAELRTTDLAFDLRNKGFQFAVLLPATPVEHGQIVGEKIVAGVKRRLPPEAAGASVTASVQILFKRDARA